MAPLVGLTKHRSWLPNMGGVRIICQKKKEADEPLNDHLSQVLRFRRGNMSLSGFLLGGCPIDVCPGIPAGRLRKNLHIPPSGCILY
jgi:hypothetical protein